MKFIYKLLLKYHSKKVCKYDHYALYQNNFEMFKWCFTNFTYHINKIKYYNDLVNKIN